MSSPPRAGRADPRAGADPGSISRRELLRLAAGAGAYLAAGGCAGTAETGALVTKAIPASGERLPVIGVGTALEHFIPTLHPEEIAARREVLDAYASMGGRLIDIFFGDETEAFVADLVRDIGAPNALFIGTKVGFGRGITPTDARAEGIERMNSSFQRFGTATLDLMQIVNLREWQTLLPVLQEWKQEGRFRYIGVTVFRPDQHEALEGVMRSEELDFVQMNYSLEGRDAEDRLLPLASDRGMAVIANIPFDRGSVFRRVGDRPLPAWAAELGCETAAQIALKFVVSHASVTCAIPGTYKMDYLLDNMGAALEPMPDAAMRRTITEWYDALPVAG